MSSAISGSEVDRSGGVCGDVPVLAESHEDEDGARCRRMASSSAPSADRLSAMVSMRCGVVSGY